MSSENYNSDQVLEDSGGVDNGNEHEAGPVEPSAESTVIPDLGFSSGEGVSGFIENSESAGSDVFLAKSPEFELSPIVQIPVSTEEDSNGFVNAESSIETQQVPVVADDETEIVSRDEVPVVHDSSNDVKLVAENEQITVVDMPASVDQESRSLQVNHADHDNGILVNTDDSVQCELSDGILTEDAGKEDMFVDAPDQLTVYDGRSADTVESVEIIETREISEKKLDIQEPQVQVLDNGTQVHHLMDELARLQAMLDKTVNEKQIIEHEYKEERETFTREFANIHNQLEVLTNQQSLLDDNNNGLVDRLHRTEIGDGEDKTRAFDIPLQDMISECSKFVLHLKGALDERLQTEGTVRELHAVLYMKDQDIEDLHAKVTELSVSRDVSDSYLESVQKIWSQSLRESSEVQLEKDLHIEDVTNRMLASLATVIRQEELVGDSVAERISHVEKGTSLLIENYNQFLSEIDKLSQCLTEVCSDFRMPEEKELGTIFSIACDEMLDRKRKEVDLVEKLNQLEDENRKLSEQLDKEKEMVETVNAEVGKTKLELGQEKIKSATTKEKLSLAVTKGKALVQQRDSLKLSLAEKTSELEKCLIELQEKSNALETAEVSTEELVKSQNLAASLQESLSQREMFIKEIEEVLSQIGTPEELQSMDITERVRWFVDQKNVFETVSLEFRKLKDVLSLIDLPETISSSDLESQVNWLGESFSQAKNGMTRLQDEISSTQAAVAVHELELVEARNEIDRLTASLLAEKQEKDSLQMGLEDLTCKYEGVVEKEYRVSSEKDQMMRMFIEASGIKMDDQGEVNQLSSEMAMFVEKCIGKIREQNRASFESSHVEAELFERIKSLLYIRDQELMLCEKILEEEMLERSEVINLSNELRISCQQVLEVKAERDSMQKDLERAEEKSALLREKLSLAVKKGKGLVQDREGLKHSLDERKTEIEKLKLKLQQQESALSDCRDQIIRLSTDVGHIPKLESDLVAMNDQRDQLEKFLVESNNMLQKVFESIEGIVLPGDAVFEQPIEKVKWLAEYFNEYQVSKTRAEQELEKVKEEASSLASRLAEAYTTMKSLEDALSEAEQNVSLLAEEMRNIEVGKTNVEKALEKAKEEVISQASKFAEACVTIKSLEDLLVAAEKNISVLVDEKKGAQVGRTSVEIELEKTKEEAGSQASKLAEAYITVKSLEDSLSQAEKNMALLAEEKNDVQVGRTSLEKELEKVKEGAGSQSSKLADAYMTIKSLEDALLQAENNISVLVDEKKIFEQEIATLNAKLAACMEELAGTHGSLETRSVELSGHLNHLQMLMKDEALLSSMKQGFKKKIERLRDMDLLLKNIRDKFSGKGSEGLRVYPGTEKDPCLGKFFSANIDSIPNGAMDKCEMAVDIDNIPSYLANIVEGFDMKNKLLEENFESFSSSVDECIAALLRALQATRDEVIVMCEHMECLEEKVNNVEVYKQAQESTISTLENDIATLCSACTYATQELQFEVVNNILDLSSDPKLEKFNNSLYSGARESGRDAMEDQQEMLDGTKFVNVAENLLLAARKVRTQTEQFENIRNVSVTFIKDLQNKLNDTRIISENALEERDLTRNRVSKLESDLEALQNLCSEMRLKLEDCQAKEDILKEREAELSSLTSTLAMKKQEADVLLLSEGQVKTLLNKLSGTEIPFFESEVENPEPHSSALVKKLFYIIDSVATLQHQMNLLSHDKDELQSCLAAQIREIEYLKKEANNQDSEKMKSEFAELALGLEKIIQKFGENDLVEEKKSAGVRGLLPVLEKQVMDVIGESENSKSKAQELGAKLLGSQKVVDELSTKVKLLEDSIHSRPAPPEIIQERSIFEAPSLASGSEISEIEDVGPVGKKSMAPVPPAAHVRTMRKGSSDHLALSIDSESDRLINHEETDEDKGHVFKSLNTSGLIPKQGKMIADRIDGIWVSGGRVLMSRPGARIGLIAYWLFLHMWLLGTIL